MKPPREDPTPDNVLSFLYQSIMLMTKEQLEGCLEYLVLLSNSEISRSRIHEQLNSIGPIPFALRQETLKAWEQIGIQHYIFTLYSRNNRLRFPKRARKIFWEQLMEKKICRFLPAIAHTPLSILVDGTEIDLFSAIPYYPPLNIEGK